MHCSLRPLEFTERICPRSHLLIIQNSRAPVHAVMQALGMHSRTIVPAGEGMPFVLRAAACVGSRSAV